MLVPVEKRGPVAAPKPLKEHKRGERHEPEAAATSESGAELAFPQTFGPMAKPGNAAEPDSVVAQP